MKGMTICKVCGRDFPLMTEEHYVARDTEKTGITNVISGSEATLYDAFNCPHCGCQNIMQERKHEYCPCDYGICSECDHPGEETFKHDGCAGCAHEGLANDEEPCSECRYNHLDYYTPKEEEDV